MTDLFNLENATALLMLVVLQAVLGFDNLLYISLESKRAPEEKQSYVRKLGIGIAVILRIGLLFGLVNLIEYVDIEIFSFDFKNVAQGHFNLHSVIVLVGGIFILYTALKEIFHMMAPLGNSLDKSDEGRKSVGSVIAWIVLMNLVFSFDSILSAMALTDVFFVMATAIIIGGILMIWLSDKVAYFLQKNRLYEVLGLFILFIVGVMLVSEGGELAHLYLFGNPIEKMSKTTFYFVIGILIAIDIVQSQYQKKLMAQQEKLSEEVPRVKN